MAWLRSVGRREQAALKAVVVKFLAGCKNLSLESRRREERIDTYRGVVPNVAHFLVVCAIGKQQLFVCPKESCVRAAVIPDERAPASGFENAHELPSGFVTIKPVGGLGGGDEIYATSVQG